MEEHKKNAIASSTVLIFVLTFFGYLGGFLVQSIIAKYLGLGKDLDAFVAVALIPEFVFGLTNAIFFTSFVVFFPEYVKKYGEQNGKIFVAKLFTIAFLALSLVVVFLFLFSSHVAMKIAPGFSVEQVALASVMIKIISVAVLFFGLSSLLTGVLFHEHMFFAPKMLRIMVSLGVITSLLLLEKNIGSMSLAVGTVLGISVAYLIQYLELRKKGYYFSFVSLFILKKAETNNSSMKELFFLAWPLIMSSLLYYLSRTIANMIASTQGQGSLSILNYAFLIITLPVVFFSGSITASIFPHMTKQSTYDNIEEMRSLFSKSLRILLFFMIPLTIVFMVLGKEIVTFLFERGAFTATASGQVAATLFFFAIGLIPSGIWGVILNLFYAMKKMKVQMWVYFCFLVLNIVLNLILVRSMSYNGIALSMSLTYWCTTIIAFWYITQEVKPFNYQEIVRSSIKMIIASLGMALSILLLRKEVLQLEFFQTPGIIIQGGMLFTILMASFIVYGATLILLRSEEIVFIVSAIKNINPNLSHKNK